MKRTWPLVLALFCCSCAPTKEPPEDKTKGGNDGPEITIPPDDLEPMNEFIMQTRRILVAEFIRVELTTQYFEERMGYTRDLRFVQRDLTTQPDGTRVLRLRNINHEQETNIDPELLPRVYFGQGLEMRAFSEIRVTFRPSRDKNRPLFITIQAKNQSGNAKLWVNGRLEHEQPTLTLRSEMIWSEIFERFKHKAAIS